MIVSDTIDIISVTFEKMLLTETTNSRRPWDTNMVSKDRFDTDKTLKSMTWIANLYDNTHFELRVTVTIKSAYPCRFAGTAIVKRMFPADRVKNTVSTGLWFDMQNTENEVEFNRNDDDCMIKSATPPEPVVIDSGS